MSAPPIEMAHQFPSDRGDDHQQGSSGSRIQREGGGSTPVAAVSSPDSPREVQLSSMSEEASAMHALSYSRQAVHAAGASGSAQSPARRFPAVSRSIPIAIRRNASSAGDTTTSDEDEDNYDDRTMDVGPCSSSRNGLLRAPYLGSLPSNAEFLLSNQNMLLPAASLGREGATATTTSSTTTTSASYSAGMLGRTGYGSLRESNLMGRFLDGPASYRERGTGGIVQVQLRNRARFDEASRAPDSAAPSTSRPISIGDQIMMHARKRQDSIDSSRNEAQQPSSSLAAMLESSSLEDPSSGTMPLGLTVPPFQGVEDAPASAFDGNACAEPDVLSMSLTGLEVLHSLRRLSSSSSKVGFAGRAPVLRQDLEHLPRDTNGNNALLSRSISDPTPQFRRLEQQHPMYGSTQAHVLLPSSTPGIFPTTQGGPFSTTTFESVAMSDASLPPATFASAIPTARTDTFPTPVVNDFSNAGLPIEATRTASPAWEDVAAPTAPNENPDTEGAFEMDLE